MKRETASYVAHGIIWASLLIVAIINAFSGGSPASMITYILIGFMGTFSVLAINSVWGRRGRADSDIAEPVRPQTAGSKKTSPERLKELQQLLDGRMITKEEFDRKRAEIIQSL